MTGSQRTAHPLHWHPRKTMDQPSRGGGKSRDGPGRAPSDLEHGDAPDGEDTVGVAALIGAVVATRVSQSCVRERGLHGVAQRHHLHLQYADDTEIVEITPDAE